MTRFTPRRSILALQERAYKRAFKGVVSTLWTKGQVFFCYWFFLLARNTCSMSTKTNVRKRFASVAKRVLFVFADALAPKFPPKYRIAPCCSTRTRDTVRAHCIARKQCARRATNLPFRERKSPDRLPCSAHRFATRPAAEASWLYVAFPGLPFGSRTPSGRRLCLGKDPTLNHIVVILGM
jgi:hypothetical protein